MTTATKMTPAEFLAMNPHDHPDFAGCDDPRLEPGNKAGRKDSTLLMPNLVELIRRIGGPDAIPDDWDRDLLRPIYHYDDPRGEAWWAECQGQEQKAMLKDLRSRRPYLTLYRWDKSLWLTGWHPHEKNLDLVFNIPADWSAAAWGIPSAMIEDVFTASYDLDRLAAEALDYWIGAIQKATETYVHIRRDRFVF
jgi:hypothetical protein